jgi:hypothetical protein
MVLFFSAIGIFLWVAVLLAVLVFCGIIWLSCKTILWLMDLYGGLSRRKVASAPKRVVPPARPATPRTPPTREVTPDIMPKWTAAHRRYVDRDLGYWQAQFDALNSRKL